MKYPVKRICSACKKFLGFADFTSSKSNAITHTICPVGSSCYNGYMAEQMAEIERMKK